MSAQSEKFQEEQQKRARLRYKLHNPAGTLVATLEHAEDAAALAGYYGAGASVMHKMARTQTVWREGSEVIAAASDPAKAAKIMHERIDEKLRQSLSGIVDEPKSIATRERKRVTAADLG